uniref:CSON005052 protein n=1 Tax=Culicoides sonorensis TaxID=179676 RepID=A0A336L6M3_CULSO
MVRLLRSALRSQARFIPRYCYHVNTNTVTSELLCAKSRVASTKSLSIARLELCVAKLLVDLVCQVKSKVLIARRLDFILRSLTRAPESFMELGLENWAPEKG